MNAYFVECRTGCSCCSGDNHYRGPFSSKEIAEKRVEEYKKMRLLASQYAANGVYYIEERDDAEQLPDGRLIINNRVYHKFVDDYIAGSDDEHDYLQESY